LAESVTEVSTLLLIVLVAVVAFAAGFAVARVRWRSSLMPASKDAPASPPASAPTPAEPTRIAFANAAIEGSPEWGSAMKEVGARMRGAGLRLVLFAHGSFVGDDPLAVASLIDDAVPLFPDIARKIRGLTRAHLSRLLGDLSNFSTEYVRAFAQATGVEALEFTWSGENHHAARVQGAVRLARAAALHGGGALRSGDRVLLVGHSHGGQLFALLSQILGRSSGYEELVAAAAARGEDVGALDDHLSVLRRCGIDVVTFGTPLRYTWARAAGFRLLHIINHRGAEAHAPSLRGVLHTRQGDYVQQLGAHGSDFPALTANERAMNARLDRVLGDGSSLRAWLRSVSRGLRVSPEGQTVLVDYGDVGGALPNFLSSGLGHAAYTRREAMLFHANLIADHFYPSRRGAPWEPWSRRVRSWVASDKLLPPVRRRPSTPEGESARSSRAEPGGARERTTR
jgi:hypothetical protein